MTSLGYNALQSVHLPCGGTAHFDPDSTTYAYVCDTCFCVVGSVGMPRECYELWRRNRDDRKK